MPQPLRRYLESPIAEDALASRKMALISGPRQVGKTILGRALAPDENNFFTWDDQPFRRRWVHDPVAAVANRGPGPILLDEIHKDRRWKNRLKGLFDQRGTDLPIVVTGSARLDLYRRGGDSLLGRYIPYRLMPFSAGERTPAPAPDEVLTRRRAQFPLADLMQLGCFPEPLLAGSRAKAKRWSRLRLERVLNDEVRDLQQIRDLEALRVLTDLLPQTVGSLFSINSLREDVGVAYATVRQWIEVLGALYHHFRIKPYARRLRRVLRAQPKLYLFDLLTIEDEAHRLENLTALHLYKACLFWTDTAQGEFELRFVRTREGEEVDFLLLREGRPWMLVECKGTEFEPAPVLVRMARTLKTPHVFQLVRRPGYWRVWPELGVTVADYELFLAGWV